MGELPPKCAVQPIKTFKDFQDLDWRIREAGHVWNSSTWGAATTWLAENWEEYRLGDFDYIVWVEGMVDEVTIKKPGRSMLMCWIDCGKDMLRAKLAWHENY